MRAVGLWTFAGLMTEGVKREFDVGYVANPGYANDTHAENHPGVAIFGGDEVLPSWAPEFVFAQPECAPWSPASARLGMDDPRLESSLKVLRTALALRPRVFVLESVAGAMIKGREFYLRAAREFEEKGYQVTHLLFDNQHTGTPQRRPRYLFIAHIDPLWLPPLGTSPVTRELFRGAPRDHVPVAFNSDKRATERFGIDSIPPGEKLHKWFVAEHEKRGLTPERNARGHMTGRPAFGCQRLHPDKIAPTFAGAYTIVHHDDHRFLDFSEARVWCAVRQDYAFIAASPAERLKQMARSVMPETAHWIARMARGTIEGRGSNLPPLPDFIDTRDGIHPTERLI